MNRQIDVSLNQETFVLYSGVIMKSTEHYVASQCLLLLLFLLLLKGCLLSWFQLTLDMEWMKNHPAQGQCCFPHAHLSQRVPRLEWHGTTFSFASPKLPAVHLRLHVYCHLNTTKFFLLRKISYADHCFLQNESCSPLVTASTLSNGLYQIKKEQQNIFLSQSFSCLHFIRKKRKTLNINGDGTVAQNMELPFLIYLE